METRENYEPTKVELHKPARPMVIIVDKEGYRWLCDKGVDPEGDFREQGCWQCGGIKMAFTRDD